MLLICCRQAVGLSCTPAYRLGLLPDRATVPKQHLPQLAAQDNSMIAPSASGWRVRNVMVLVSCPELIKPAINRSSRYTEQQVAMRWIKVNATECAHIALPRVSWSRVHLAAAAHMCTGCRLLSWGQTTNMTGDAAMHRSACACA